DELDDVVEEHAGAMYAGRHPVEIPAQGIRDGLRLEVDVETGELSPARVTTQLDEAGAEHQPEQRPCQQDAQPRARRSRRATQEHREEPQLEQQRLPAERVERLPDVHE